MMMLKMLFVLTVALLTTVLPRSAGAQRWNPERATSATAVLSAPELRSPANGTVLPGIGPVTLSWNNPAGATQYQVQLTPYKDDGPGINLIRSPDTSTYLHKSA